MKRVLATNATEEATALLSDLWPSPHAALRDIVNAFPDLYESTLCEIQGKLQRAELAAVLECGRDSLDISDCPDRILKKWQICRNDIQDKIMNLTSFQRFCLSRWAHGYWHGEIDMRSHVSIGDYVWQLCGDV